MKFVFNSGSRLLAPSFCLIIVLIFALIVGLNSTLPSHSNIEEGPTEDFHTHMLQAMEDLKVEVTTERENLRQVIHQVQEIFDSMDIQKQKLQNFIEEVREQFKTDYSEHSVNNYADQF